MTGEIANIHHKQTLSNSVLFSKVVDMENASRVSFDIKRRKSGILCIKLVHSLNCRFNVIDDVIQMMT